MIVGGILITIVLITYYLYNPKLPIKGSLSYYRYKWRQLDN
jgi:hypothetical protein